MRENRLAAYITRPGPADAIQIGELPIPVCGPTDVLVRTEAMAVNFVDTFVRSGAYRTPLPTPFIIGRDMAGVVEEVGEGVSGFQAGDAVWCNSLGHQGRQGSFAEYVSVPCDRLYHLPTGVDYQLMVSLAHTAATAHLALFREAELRLGETVLIGGAAGGVGSAAVQLAHIAGARVIATAREQDAPWCQACGADVVIDYRDPHAADQIRSAAPEGIDVHLDTSGHHDFDVSLPLLALGARLVLMAAMSARPPLPIGAVYTRDISLHGFAISNASVADLADAAQTINTLLATNRLQSRIAARLPLRDAARAHRLLENPAPDRPPGRILVLP